MFSTKDFYFRFWAGEAPNAVEVISVRLRTDEHKVLVHMGGFWDTLEKAEEWSRGFQIGYEYGKEREGND